MNEWFDTTDCSVRSGSSSCNAPAWFDFRFNSGNDGEATSGTREPRRPQPGNNTGAVTLRPPLRDDPEPLRYRIA